MGEMEYCEDTKSHIPHEYPAGPESWMGTNVCAGELKSSQYPAEAALHFTLAAVLQTKNDVGSAYGDSDAEALVGHRLEGAFEKLADNLRAILESK